MIRLASLTNLVYTGLVALSLFLFGAKEQAVQALFGGGLVGLNLAALIWAFHKIFQKKSVAFAVAVIVFKYAALVLILFRLYHLGWKVDLGFLAGLSALFPALGTVAYRYLKQSEGNGSF